jgi:hypothetical protein
MFMDTEQTTGGAFCPLNNKHTVSRTVFLDVAKIVVLQL